MEKFYIIIVLFIILLVLYLRNNNLCGVKKEHAGNVSAQTLSNEAIQNIASVYGNTDGEAVFNNIRVTGKAQIENFEGIIVMWSGTKDNIPPGWVLCDGTNGTPDLRGRFILGHGKGENLTERQIGQKGGSETHTLTIQEMPSHSHKWWNILGSGDNKSDVREGIQYLYGNDRIGQKQNINASNQGRAINKVQELDTSISGGDKTITTVPGYNATEPSTWAAKPHNNMPPFYVLAYIMKEFAT